MTTIGMPELVIVVSMLLTFVAVPIIVIAIARGLIDYGRNQERRELESRRPVDPGPTKPRNGDLEDAEPSADAVRDELSGR